LNPITQGTRTKEDEFEFNKDAGMYVCKAGHMAIRKARQGKKNVGKNQKDTYYFDVEKCKVCPFREGCYTAGAKSKTYYVTIKSKLLCYNKNRRTKKTGKIQINGLVKRKIQRTL